MAEDIKQGESFEFQAEIKKLLNILSHSLYTHKEVFLRELISNASDALTKMRYYSLSNPDYEGKDLPLEIHIDVDEKNKILTISDTGIGMTRDEVVQNVGTIAKSGSLEFIANCQSRPGRTQISLVNLVWVSTRCSWLPMRSGSGRVRTTRTNRHANGIQMVRENIF